MEISSSAVSETLQQALTSRGWCIGNVEQVQSLIVIQLALHGESCTVDLIESELANTDLRSVGGQSLPDSSILRKSSHLDGPKVLQIASVRDISCSSIAETLGNSNNHRRLLRLKLTDGHSEITAIEYSHIASIPNDVVPGTKVRLEDKAVMHCGIVCLVPKVITVLGGVVESLFEEWQMNQKYSGYSRSSLRFSQESQAGGPPPFEKLQIGSSLHRHAQQGRVSQISKSSSKSLASTYVEIGESSESRQMTRVQNYGIKVSNKEDDVKSSTPSIINEENPTCTEARPKEVAESVPIQNQAAAQKLLQKMSQPNRNDRQSRGQNLRARGKQEYSSLLTLDEWERRKAGRNLLVTDELPHVSQDEDLARQLQEQYNLEDVQIQRGPVVTEADNIRMSMFSFQKEDNRAHSQTGFRGRGRGGGRGRGRGRRGDRGRGPF